MDVWSIENEQVPVSLYVALSDHKSRPPLAGGDATSADIKFNLLKTLPGPAGRGAFTLHLLHQLARNTAAIPTMLKQASLAPS